MLGTRVSLRVVVLALLAALSATSASRAAHPPKYFVQKRFVQVTTGTTVPLALPRPTRAGNLLVAFVAWDNAAPASITDSLGNTYQSPLDRTASGADGGCAQLFYAANVAAGADTVTVRFSTAIAARAAVYLFEYTGLDRVAPLDTAVAAAGTGATIDSGPLTAAVANELLFVGAESNGPSIARLSKGWKAPVRRYGNLTAEQIPAAPGSYRATALQRGTSWAIQVAAFKPAGSTPPATVFPLAVGPTGRYLVDRNGTPFLIMGDSPQALTVNLSETEADAYFADRQAAGFNAVWVNLLCATYTGGRADGSTYDGIVPFTTPDDLSTPNEAFFTRVDHLLNLAAAHGLVVLLDPAETGSYLSVLNANGTAKARTYGRYLGTRYRNVDNIVWMSGNDFQTWENPGDDAVVQAVARGIHDTDDRHLHTVELDYLVSGSLDDPGWAPLIELNASYSYYPTYAQVLTDYDRPNAIPTFLVEANYEFEHNAADLGTPQILRRQEYWSLLSGATGQLYGNRYTWPFVAGWQSHLDTPGSQQFGYVKFLFQPRRWWDLVPDQSHTLVTAGYGTYVDTGALGDSDYLTAARTADGALAMAYMPTARTITVDLSRLAAATTASWYDPSNGTFTAIAGSPFANAGTHDFTPPGNNADGDGDWVLVLDAGTVPPDHQPPSTPAGLAATAVGATQVSLAWNASTDDVAVAGYRVYGDGVLVRTTPSTATTDAGLLPSTTYSYTVVAYDYANNASPPSAPLPITTASPGPTFVQATAATPQSPQSVVQVSYTLDQTGGDANVVAVGWNDTVASIVSVVDSAHNVYQVAIPTFRGNGMSQAIFVAPNVVAASGGGNTVTVTFDQPAVFVDLRATEYAGLRHPSPFDTGASGTGVGTSAGSGSVTTSAAGALLFVAGMTGTTFTAPGAGFTTRTITSPDGDLVADAIAGAAGGYGATASVSSGTWLLQLAAFAAGP